MILKTSTMLLTALFAAMSWAQVELNNATEVDLDGLRGVGPGLTRQFLGERQKGAFANWSDVMQRVKGMGPQKAASLSAQGLRVQGQVYAPSGPASQAPVTVPAASSVSCCHTQ